MNKAAEVRRLFYTKKPRFFDDDDKSDKDEDEVTTESESETEERRNELKSEKPLVHLNQLQVRNLLSSHFMAQYGVKPSLANSRVGVWLQRVANAYRKTIEKSHTPEPTYKIFYEGFFDDPGLYFRSFMTAPFEQGGTTRDENWSKIGAYHVTFDMDIADCIVIADVRIYVSLKFCCFYHCHIFKNKKICCLYHLHKCKN